MSASRDLARSGAAVLLLAAALAAGAGAAGQSDARPDRERPAAGRYWPAFPYPSGAQMRAAAGYAAARSAPVSFAVLRPGGRPRGLDVDLQFSSASASKVLMLAAELRRLRDSDAPLDSSTRETLEAMITYSDNGAADLIYARVGDTGMSEVAERAGMRSFEPVPGYWGGAQITAADMARFYLGLNRNLVQPYRGFGRRLLAGITETQRWGIPRAAGPGWRIFFKGGWRPYAVEETSGPVSHQAALLRYRNGERLALAILTEEAPGDPGGFETIEEVARRLLRPPPPGPLRWPAA
jgi:beta-lactamase class A